MNKQNHIYSNFFVIISMVCMHYKVSEDGFTLQSLLDLQIQGSYSSPILNHAFDFWLGETYFCIPLEKWYSQNRTSQTGSTALEYSYNFCLNYYTLGLLNVLHMDLIFKFKTQSLKCFHGIMTTQ